MFSSEGVSSTSFKMSKTFSSSFINRVCLFLSQANMLLSSVTLIIEAPCSLAFPKSYFLIYNYPNGRILNFCHRFLNVFKALGHPVHQTCFYHTNSGRPWGPLAPAIWSSTRLEPNTRVKLQPAILSHICGAACWEPQQYQHFHSSVGLYFFLIFYHLVF